MVTERQMEQAEALEESARAQGRANVARAMHGAGSDRCVGCGEAISSARRAAAPWAIRCINCQTGFERALRRLPNGF